MSASLTYDENKFHENINLENILNSPDDSDIGYFVAVDLKYTDEIKEKTKLFPLAPENKKFNPDNFLAYMNKNKPDNYTQTKKLEVKM